MSGVNLLIMCKRGLKILANLQAVHRSDGVQMSEAIIELSLHHTACMDMGLLKFDGRLYG